MVHIHHSNPFIVCSFQILGRKDKATLFLMCKAEERTEQVITCTYVPNSSRCFALYRVVLVGHTSLAIEAYI